MSLSRPAYPAPCHIPHCEMPIIHKAHDHHPSASPAPMPIHLGMVNASYNFCNVAVSKLAFEHQTYRHPLFPNCCICKIYLRRPVFAWTDSCPVLWQTAGNNREMTTYRECHAELNAEIISTARLPLPVWIILCPPSAMTNAACYAELIYWRNYERHVVMKIMLAAEYITRVVNHVIYRWRQGAFPLASVSPS